MNTEKVYFGKVFEITEANRTYFGDFIHMDYVKDALVVLRRNVFGKKYMQDLNTDEKYIVNIPVKKGVLHVSRRRLRKFNEVTNNKVKKMSKSKVKALGNIYIKDKEK